jgi:hypothetical protein
MATVEQDKNGQVVHAVMLPEAKVSLELTPEDNYGLLVFRDTACAFRITAPMPLLRHLTIILRSAGLDGDKRWPR